MSPASSNKSKTAILRTALAAVLLMSLVLLSYKTRWPVRLWNPIYGGMSDELKDSDLYEDMNSGKSFCFMGDSITRGSMTNGITWYEPLIPYIRGDISNVSYGGLSTCELLQFADTTPYADVYVVAIGINDVLFADDTFGATTGSEYVSSLEDIDAMLRRINPDARIYYIAPWPMLGFEDYAYERQSDFADSLESWCDGTDRIAIDPYPVIMDVFAEEDISLYMLNNFHPNGSRGPGLFSYAVLYQDHQRRIS